MVKRVPWGNARAATEASSGPHKNMREVGLANSGLMFVTEKKIKSSPCAALNGYLKVK